MTSPAAAEVTAMVALEQLDPNHWPNPRGDVDTTSPAFLELAASIAAQGMLEPIVIGPALDELDGRHPIIAGWRRYTAALVAGTPAVPVHHRPDIADEASALRAALAENLAREGMTPLAEASAIARLVELGDTQVAAAAAVGVSERTARERLQLLKLPPLVRDGIGSGQIPTTCTRQLQLVADASPAAATAIAERIAKGTMRALDVIDPARLHVVLRELASGHKAVDLVELKYNAALSQLGLPASTFKELKARNKGAVPSWQDGTYIDLSPSSIGKGLLAEARAAGKLLELPPGSYGASNVYLGGRDWIERFAIAAIERGERARKKEDADRATARQQHPAHDAPEAPDVEDLESQTLAAWEAAAAAVDANAQPYAAAMNAELAERLRDLRSCKIEGPVASLLLRALFVGDFYFDEDTFAACFLHVDPERRLAEGWPEPLGEPERAVAELVGALVADHCCDPRSDGESDALGKLSHWYMGDGFGELVHQVAIALELLPDRAVRLAAARNRLDEQNRFYDRRRDRRRILTELAKSKALAADTLRERTRVLDHDPGPLVAQAIYSPQCFDEALEQLLQLEHARSIEKETDDGVVQTTYAITPAGRAALIAPAEPAPIIETIDDEQLTVDDVLVQDDVELQLVDEPAADADELHIVLEQPERSVPSRQRRARALELIGEHPGITIPELAHAMAIKQAGLYRLLPALQDDGLVRKDGRGWHPGAAEVPA